MKNSARKKNLENLGEDFQEHLLVHTCSVETFIRQPFISANVK